MVFSRDVLEEELWKEIGGEKTINICNNPKGGPIIGILFFMSEAPYCIYRISGRVNILKNPKEGPQYVYLFFFFYVPTHC